MPSISLSIVSIVSVPVIDDVISLVAKLDGFVTSEVELSNPAAVNVPSVSLTFLASATAALAVAIAVLMTI